MSLVSAKSPECGGNINVDSESRAGVCEFCKQPFVIEDAINNYNTYNQNTYNIENAEIHINETNDEQRLESAEIFLTKLGNKEEAKKIFSEVSKTSPGNYKSWWGLARIDTDEFSFDERKLDYYKDVKKYVENAISVAGPDEAKKLKDKWHTFKLEIIEYKKKIKYKLDDLQRKNTELNHVISPLEHDIAKQEAKVIDIVNQRVKLQKEKEEKQNVSIAKTIIKASVVAFVLWFIIGGGIKVSTIGTDQAIDNILLYIIVPVFVLGVVMQIVTSYQMHSKEKKISVYNDEETICRQDITNNEKKLHRYKAEYGEIRNNVAELNKKIDTIDLIVK